MRYVRGYSQRSNTEGRPRPGTVSASLPSVRDDSVGKMIMIYYHQLVHSIKMVRRWLPVVSSSTVWRRAFAAVFSVLLVTSVVPMPAGAQSESEQWARIFGGEPGGVAFGMIATDDGLLVAGQQWESLDTDDSDATLVHLDRAGEPVWIETYRDEGSDGWERATNVVETDDGYVFTGGSGFSG